ncbi:MAG TPA: hypothetical protein VF006_33805 [Longimicrobium sp.]
MTGIGEVAGGALAEIAIERGLLRAVDLQWRFLPSRVWRRKEPLRVSFAALLRISVGNAYVLIRNLHRDELFAPLGGVYKHYLEARPFLDSIGFRPQGSGPDMFEDLRGVIQRHHALKLDRWFCRNEGRESYIECLCRELKEEFGEARLKSRIRLPDPPRFTLVRRIREGPRRVDGGHFHSQFRLIEVYDLSSSSPEAREFAQAVVEAAATNTSLLIVTAEEILRRRSRAGKVIAHSSRYLLHGEPVDDEEPPHADSPGKC